MLFAVLFEDDPREAAALRAQHLPAHLRFLENTGSALSPQARSCRRAARPKAGFGWSRRTTATQSTVWFGKTRSGRPGFANRFASPPGSRSSRRAAEWSRGSGAPTAGGQSFAGVRSQKIPASRPAAIAAPRSRASSRKLSCHAPLKTNGGCTARQRSPVVILSTARRVPVPSCPARM